MFKLPVFDEKHPRFKKSMELDIQLHGYPDWKYKSNIVLDDTLPDGFVWSRSFQAEYDLNETINKTVDDLRCNLVIDLHKRKSYFERNRKFNKVLWNVPKFVIEDDQYTIAKNPYFINEYGVADSPEQILNHYKFLENEADNYFVCMTPVYKKHQEKSGGWRWHKWGQYIGTKKRSGCEYLYDEPHIDMVIVFHVYKFKDSSPTFASKRFNFMETGSNKFYMVYFNNIHFCTIDMINKNVKTWDPSSDDIILSTFDTKDAENIVEWFEANYQDNWYYDEKEMS